MPKQYDEKKIDRIRERAMQVLLRVHSEGAYANVALADALRGAEIGAWLRTAHIRILKKLLLEKE